MKRKKITALLLAGIMAVSLMGCSGDSAVKSTSDNDGTKQEGTSENGTSENSSSDAQSVSFPLSETKEYSLFAIMDGEYDLQDNVVMKKVTEEANIKFNYQSVMGADLAEKRNLVLASGDYPDIFFKASLTMSNLDKYGKQGIFIPLEDLIRDYAPNLTAKLNEIDGWDYITSGDGHIYSLPEISRRMGSVNTFWINKRWMDNLSLSEPKSLDELYEVLKAFKEQDANGNGDSNDEIPMTGTDVAKPDNLLAYFGVPYDYSSKTAVLNGTLTYIPAADVFKDYITYIKKLYQEGILDKNVFTQKHEQQGAIGQSGDVFGAFFDAGAFLTVGRDNDDDYIALTPFEDGIYPLHSGIFPGTLAITDVCENPEVIIAWADQFYSEEGGILAWMGIEGETWKLDADGNWEWIIENGYGDNVAAVRSSATIQGAANHPSIQPDFWFDHMSAALDPDEVYLIGERNKIAEKGEVPLPAMRYSEDDSMTIATLKADIDVYIDQYVAQVVTGKLELEKSWDEYITTLNNMGADKLTEIYTNAYQTAITR